MAKVSSLSFSFRFATANSRYGKRNVIVKIVLHALIVVFMDKPLNYKLHYFPPGFKFNRGKFAVKVMLLIKFQNLKSPFVTLPIIQEQIQQLFVLLQQNSQSDVISLVNQVGASHNHLATHISGNFFFFFSS
jgi:hypothetical protein